MYFVFFQRILAVKRGKRDRENQIIKKIVTWVLVTEIILCE